MIGITYAYRLSNSKWLSFLGKDIVAVDSPFGRLGVTVCYDLRFPELYQQLRFNHEAQVQASNFLIFIEKGVLLFLTFSMFHIVIKSSGPVSTRGFHKSNWSGTLGNSSTCSCHRNSMLCTKFKSSPAVVIMTIMTFTSIYKE